MVLEGDVAIFATGESEIILTRLYQKEYAENFMMQVLVDDLDACVIAGRGNVPALNRPCEGGRVLRLMRIVKTQQR